MSEIVSVVSGEAEESESDTDDEEVSSDSDGGATNDDTTTSAGGGRETNAGLRPSKPPRPRPLRTLSAQPGVIVQGEASETDSDDETSLKPNRSASDPSSMMHEGLPPLKVEFSSKKDDPRQFLKQDQHDKPPSRKEPPALKYDTLLHRKLQERNACLQTAVYAAVANVFHTSAKELAEANQMLGKSQTVIQDVCHNLRVFTTDLKQIEQKLDAVTSCANIPHICIDKGGT